MCALYNLNLDNNDEFKLAIAQMQLEQQVQAQALSNLNLNHQLGSGNWIAVPTTSTSFNTSPIRQQGTVTSVWTQPLHPAPTRPWAVLEAMQVRDTFGWSELKPRIFANRFAHLGLTLRMM